MSARGKVWEGVCPQSVEILNGIAWHFPVILSFLVTIFFCINCSH